MIAIVLIACLKTNSNLCEEQHLIFAPELGMSTCLSSAQPQLARWAEANPTRTVVQWRCENFDPSEVEI